LADVFLSYAREDGSAAERLYEHLTTLGRSVFLDRRRIEAGTRWEARLRGELNAARCVLVLWSNASLRSDWVREEAELGWARRRLVQALLESVQPPEPFAGLQATDAIGWEGDARRLFDPVTGAVDSMIRLPVGAPDAVAEAHSQMIESLDESVPQKELGKNLLLCTWNIRSFDRLTDAWTAGREESPKRDLRSIHTVAEVVRRFDLVVIQEVRESREALRFLTEEALGEEWSVIVLEPDPSMLGSVETTALVFDTRRIVPSGVVDRLALPEAPDQAADSSDAAEPFVTQPYAAFFRTRLAPTTFGLVVLRVAYSKTSAPANRLSNWMAWLRDRASSLMSSGHSLLLLGDFGVDRSDDPLYQTLVSGGVSVPVELSSVPRTVFEFPGPGNFVDHVAWISDHAGKPLMVLGYEGRAGSFDFVEAVNREDTKVALSWRISDHYPLWVELTTPPTTDPSPP
jgi:endonuclease/exonuclease/phosphatase family metal-dependent hydrolase